MKSNSLRKLVIALPLALVGVENRPVAAQPPNLPNLNAALPVGDDPRGGIVGDFNGDGKLDIATANQESSDVSILLAKDAGQFQKAKNSPVKVGASPRSLATGDFNGDKKLDLAVGNSGANSVSILLGDGSGQFAAAPGAPVKVGSRPLAVAVADFDGDDKTDLVVVNNASDNVSILLGNGKGGFQEAVGSPFGVGKTPFFVAVSDLNSDGQADLVVVNSGSNSVSVLKGEGLGSFGAKTDFPTETSPRSIAVADFNSDGKSDLVVANAGANSVSFLPGKGNGKFGDKTDFPVGPSPRSVVAADFNNNGKLDLAVTSYSANKVFVLSGDGAGGFAAATGTPYAVGSEPLWSMLTEINGDTKPDLVVVNSDSNDISLLIGNGINGFKQ